GCRELLGLVDGSEVPTYGKVSAVSWTFGYYPNYAIPFVHDFHVLENLTCDIVLSNEFLFGCEAFSTYREYFNDYLHNNTAQVRLIKRTGKSVLELTADEREHYR